MEQTTSYNATYGFPISEIALRLLANLQANSLSLPDTDATSVIDLLYHTYTDCLGQDPQEIQDGFLALDYHLEPLTLDANNSVFCIVCELCGAYEKRAFNQDLIIVDKMVPPNITILGVSFSTNILNTISLG